jgi:hypothetical protein
MMEESEGFVPYYDISNVDDYTALLRSHLQVFLPLTTMFHRQPDQDFSAKGEKEGQNSDSIRSLC